MTDDKLKREIEGIKGAKVIPVTDEMREENPELFGPPEGKFLVTCRSCRGKGRIDVVFGGPPRDPCDTCGGSGVQVVDKLKVDEWRRKRHLITNIPGLCKDCGSWDEKTGICDIFEKETISGDTTIVREDGHGGSLVTHDFERKRKPNDSCNEFNERKVR